MSRRPLERWLPVAFIAALMGQAIFLACFMGACAGGADSSGYLNTARLIARCQTSASIRTIEESGAAHSWRGIDDVYTPLGFRPMLGAGKISSIYPIGLPLFVTAAAKVTGWQWGPALAIALHALLGVVLVYALGEPSPVSRGSARRLALPPSRGRAARKTVACLRFGAGR